MASRSGLDRFQIPEPCQQDWTAMPGDHRSRSCAACNKALHNLSSLTRREAHQLLHQSNGTLCARIERDASGNIQFQPESKRLPKLTTILLSFAAPLAAANCPVKITTRDASTATIPANVKIGPDGFWQPSNPSGVFETKLAPGKYSLKISSPGFVSQTLTLEVSACDKPIEREVTLAIGEVTMGVIVELPNIKPHTRLLNWLRRR